MSQLELDDQVRVLNLVTAAGGAERDAYLVEIPGDPPSKARPRFNSRGRPYTPQKTVDGEKRIATALTGAGPFPSNVVVACVFYRSTLQRIDIDNLMKAVLDGATRARVWDDDSQVTALMAILEHDRANPRTLLAIAPHASTLHRGTAALVACAACGTLFKPAGSRRRGYARWCSNACRTYLAEPIACAHCSQPFKRANGNQRFCSVACRAASTRALDRVCVDCGKPIAKRTATRCRTCFLAHKAAA